MDNEIKYCVGRKPSSAFSYFPTWSKIIELGESSSIDEIKNSKNRYCMELYTEGSGYEGSIDVCEIIKEKLFPIEQVKISELEKACLENN